MKQRLIALLLALALTLSLCAVTALADGQSAAQDQTAAQAPSEPDAEENDAPGGAEAAVPETSPAGPDPEPAMDPETGEPLTEAVKIVPDEIGTVSFANLERRIRKNNLQLLVLQENVDTLEELDYDKLYEDLRKQLNSIAQGKWGLSMMGQGESFAHAQLEQGYNAVREQFDAIKDGDMQEDNAGVMRQLKNLQDQIVMGGETMYVAIAAMETQEAGLQRQLTALNRTVEEMELRYQLGQISALQLSQVKAGRTSLVSGLETLQMNIQVYKTQLEMMIGAEQTGEILLGAVPAVTEKQLESMDLEKDLLAAKDVSYEIYAAEKTLADAKEDYLDALTKYGYKENSMEFMQARHTWQADQYTYNNTIQNYELKFRTLYAQVKDYQQIWEASKVSLACQQDTYASMELKYQQGTISKNALLDAQDDLREAEEAVKTAANNLFSSYNTYCWAVQHGILN